MVACSDYALGLPRFIDDKGEVMGPTNDQMGTFIARCKITMEEAWHRFHGESLVVRFALQMFAFGSSGDSFKAELGDDKRILSETGKKQVQPNAPTIQEMRGDYLHCQHLCVRITL